MNWSKWWFLNGGMLHGLWKQRQYKAILELAKKLPKAAWDEQQKEIDRLAKQIESYIEQTRLIDEHSEDFDLWCECKMCQSYMIADCDPQPETN